jgi:hypothetical protein
MQFLCPPGSRLTPSRWWCWCLNRPSMQSSAEGRAWPRHLATHMRSTAWTLVSRSLHPVPLADARAVLGRSGIRVSRRFVEVDALLRAVKPTSHSQWNGSYGADSGPSRGDRCRRTIRPIEASKAAICNGRFTSTPAGGNAQNSGHSLTLIAVVENDCVDSSPKGGPWLELKLGDRDCLRSSISPQSLRGHAEGSQEGTTHAFAVRKTRFLRDQFYRVPASLHHEPGSF